MWLYEYVCSPSLLVMICEPIIHWSFFSSGPCGPCGHGRSSLRWCPHCCDSTRRKWLWRHINRWDSPSDKVMAGMVHRFLLFWFQTGWRWWLFTGGSSWFMFRLRLIWRYFEVVTWETETKLCLIQGANSSWKAMNPASGGFRYRVGWQAKAKPRQTRWVTLIKAARLFSQDQDNAYNK